MLLRRRSRRSRRARALEIRKDTGGYSLLRKSGGERDALPPPKRRCSPTCSARARRSSSSSPSTRTIAAAIKRHKDALEANDVGRYFHTNSKLVIPGAIIALAALLAGVFARGAAPELAGAGFMLVWLGGWSLGVVVLVASVISAWRSPAGVAAYASALFLTLFSLPFVAGEIVGLGMFAAISGVGLTVIALLLVATNFAFFHWLKAPTPEGRKLLDRIAGLRLYLGVAERDDARRAEGAAADHRRIPALPAVRARARRREDLGRQVRRRGRTCRGRRGSDDARLVSGRQHLEPLDLHQRHRLVAELVDLIVVDGARLVVGRRWRRLVRWRRWWRRRWWLVSARP